MNVGDNVLVKGTVVAIWQSDTNRPVGFRSVRECAPEVRVRIKTPSWETIETLQSNATAPDKAE